MTPIPPTRSVDTRRSQGSTRLRGGVPVLLPVAMAQSAFLRFGIVDPKPGTSGHVSASPVAGEFGTAIVNWNAGDRVAGGGGPFLTPKGSIWVRASQDCDLTIDVLATGR